MRILVASVALLFTASVSAQTAVPNPKPAPSTPVTVTNTPLPVTVQGGVSVGGNVTIGNTAQNPVPIVGSVSNDEVTKLLSDGFYQVTSPLHDDPGAPQIGPIDIKNYKNVRVVLSTGSCGPCGDWPTAFVRTMGTVTSEARTIDSLHINNPDLDIGKFASGSYDTAGTGLVIQLLADKLNVSYGVRVMVFGRPN